ncbi:MAG: polyphenol oxidase family protein [Planctomycetaceae bacterium]|nr:polyphenol oxidase family protein [Planctomycetaceae bacterium]
MLQQPAAIPFAFPRIPGVRCLFSTRHAGDLALRDECRDRLIALARDGGISRLAEMRQVHGNTMVRAQEGDPPEADCLYTGESGLGLVVRTADCQPILFARDDGCMVACLHLGWRGNAGEYIRSIVTRLCEHFDCSPDRLAAVRGPSLGPAAAEFVNFEKEWPASFAPWFDAAARTMDLWSLTKTQLARAGIPPGRIYSLDLCTRDMPDMFFSHRRGDLGRQVGIIWRTE